MITRVFLQEIDDNTIKWNNSGALTDVDIYAGEGQKVNFNGSQYIIKEICFKMISTKENIDTEKHMYLEEVEWENYDR